MCDSEREDKIKHNEEIKEKLDRTAPGILRDKYVEDHYVERNQRG